MILLRCLVAMGLFIGFLTGAWRNALSLWSAIIRKDEFPSPLLLPLVPGAMGAVAFAIFPFYSLIEWRWLPLLLDLGCLPTLCIASLGEARKGWIEWRLTGPFVSCRELRHQPPTDFEMVARLYRNGQLRLFKSNISPRFYQKKEPYWLDLIHLTCSGTWTEDGDRLVFKTGTLEVIYRKVDPSHYVWQESNRKNAFDGIDLQTV